MNILYIADSSSWHNAKWTEYFSERHNVFLFSDYKENYKPVYFNENIKLIQIPPLISTGSRHLDKLSSLFYYSKMVNELIVEYDIDVIHCVAIYYAFLGTFLKTNKPIIYTQQGSELLVKAKTNWLYRYMARRVFSNVAAVTGDSRVIQAAGYKYGALEGNNHIIQNGVDLRMFNSLEKEDQIPNLCSDDYCVKLYSPRAITPLYNIDIIIESLAILKNTYKLNFKCQFTYGFGEEHLEKYSDLVIKYDLDNYIEWVGYVDFSEMPNYYRYSDIVLSIPTSDSSPKSVYESMACGTPVVVSDLPWVDESLTNNFTVVVCDIRSASSLAENIMKLVRDSDLYMAIRKNACSMVKAKFSYESEMKKMENIMLDLVDG